MPYDKHQPLDSYLEPFREFPADAHAEIARKLSESMAAANETEDLSWLGVLLLAQGVFLRSARAWADAIPSFTRAQELALSLGDENLLLHVLFERGKIDIVLGDISSGLDALGEALVLARALHNQTLEVKLLSNIGFVYGQQDDPEPYLDYTRQSLALSRLLQNKRFIAHNLCNMGGALTRLGRYEEAEACYQEGMPLAIDLSWKQCEGLFLAGLGGLLCEQGKLPEGHQYYNESNAIFAALQDHFQLARHHLLLGGYYLQAQQPVPAKAILQLGIELAETHQFKSTLWQLYDCMSKSLEALGDSQGALRALRSYVKLKEENFTEHAEERIRNITLRQQIETARKETLLEKRHSAELESTNANLVAALRKQKELQAELERIASTDLLTGLLNRRQMEISVTREIARSLRAKRPLALVLLDIDHFKHVNDNYGHAIGDEVLMELAARLKRSVREVDLISRWGGEEFCVVLIDTEADGARHAAERMRSTVADKPFLTSTGEIPVTISLGICSLQEHCQNLYTLLLYADQALYNAKNLGRNQVALAAKV